MGRHPLFCFPVPISGLDVPIREIPGETVVHSVSLSQLLADKRAALLGNSSEGKLGGKSKADDLTYVGDGFPPISKGSIKDREGRVHSFCPPPPQEAILRRQQYF